MAIVAATSTRNIEKTKIIGIARLAVSAHQRIKGDVISDQAEGPFSVDEEACIASAIEDTATREWRDDLFLSLAIIAAFVM